MAVLLSLWLAVMALRDAPGNELRPHSLPERPQRKDSGSHLKPFFYNFPKSEIEAGVSSTVFLNCAVKQLEDKSVSWIRRRDLHILTVGIYTYTKDSRFQCLHDHGSSEWVLRILSVRTNDSGTYDCQVNTEPKTSHSFVLKVYEAKAMILGNGEVYLRSGNALTLTCKVEPSSTQIRWMKDQDEVSDDLVRQSQGTSLLRIDRTSFRHSGKYTCTGKNVRKDSVLVHIIRDEQQAAIHHSLGSKKLFESH